MKRFGHLAPVNLAMALVGLLVAAGCDDGIASKRSNDITLDPRGSLCSDQNAGASMVFPRVTPPRTEVQVVSVGQGGETDLKVTKIFLEDYPDCDRTVLGLTESDRLPDDVLARCPLMIDSVGKTLPAVLGSDENFSVNIRFQPTDLRVPPPTRLVIESNALDKKEMCVGIGFQAAIPEIAADPVVAFPGGVSGTEFLLVRNIGSGPLVVQQRTLTLVSEPALDPQTQEPVPEFIVTEQTALPWEIAANGAETVQIEYRPFDGSRDTAELTFVSNDPEHPEFKVTLTSAPVYGVLNIDPNPAVFGVPRPGEGVERVISFTNSGVRFVDVQAVVIDQAGTDYAISSNQQTSFRLAGGQSREVRVVYQPQTAAGSDATLKVRYDDGDDRTPADVEVPLVRDGAALPAIINVEPASVDMSDVALGATKTQDITLTNTGGADLAITRIALSDDGDAGAGLPASDPEFELVSGGGAVTLGTGESHVVQVKLTRDAEQRIVLIAALVVESNAVSSPDVVFFTSNPPQQ